MKSSKRIWIILVIIIFIIIKIKIFSRIIYRRPSSRTRAWVGCRSYGPYRSDRPFSIWLIWGIIGRPWGSHRNICWPRCGSYCRLRRGIKCRPWWRIICRPRGWRIICRPRGWMIGRPRRRICRSWRWICRSRWWIKCRPCCWRIGRPWWTWVICGPRSPRPRSRPWTIWSWRT